MRMRKNAGGNFFLRSFPPHPSSRTFKLEYEYGFSLPNIPVGRDPR